MNIIKWTELDNSVSLDIKFIIVFTIVVENLKVYYLHEQITKDLIDPS